MTDPDETMTPADPIDDTIDYTIDHEGGPAAVGADDGSDL